MDDDISSPDPLAGSPTTSHIRSRTPSVSPTKRRSQPRRASTSASTPGSAKKQIDFVLTPTKATPPRRRALAKSSDGDGDDPWHIRVTVEASPQRQMDASGPGIGDFQTRTTTMKIPLKGLESSPPAEEEPRGGKGTPKKRTPRARSRKSAGDAVKRTGTPVPNKRRGRRKTLGPSELLSEEDGEGFGMAGRRGRREGSILDIAMDDEDEGAAVVSPQCESPRAALGELGSNARTSPKKSPKKRESRKSQGQSTKSPRRSSRRGSVKDGVSEELVASMHEASQLEDDQSFLQLPSPEPSPEQKMYMQEQEQEQAGDFSILPDMEGEDDDQGMEHDAGSHFADEPDDSILASEGFSMISTSSLPFSVAEGFHRMEESPKLTPATNSAGKRGRKDYGSSPFKQSAALEEKSTIRCEDPTPRSSPMHESQFEISDVPSLSHVRSSPPMLVLPAGQDQVTPTPSAASSPQLPPPIIAQDGNSTNSGTKEEKNPHLSPVYRAGKALQGVLGRQSPQAKSQQHLSPTVQPKARSAGSSSRSSRGSNGSSNADDVFVGFGPGTRRKLRASLLLGEELARYPLDENSPLEAKQERQLKESSKIRDQNDVFAPSGQAGASQSGGDVLTVSRAEADVQYPVLPSPKVVDEEMDWQNDTPVKVFSPAVAVSLSKQSSQNLLWLKQQQPAASQSSPRITITEENEQGQTEITEGEIDMSQFDVTRFSTMSGREDKWARERAEVVRQIENASRSQVIVIDSDSELDQEEEEGDGEAAEPQHAEYEEEEASMQDHLSPDAHTEDDAISSAHEEASTDPSPPVEADDEEEDDVWQQDLNTPQPSHDEQVVPFTRGKIPSPWRRAEAPSTSQLLCQQLRETTLEDHPTENKHQPGPVQDAASEKEDDREGMARFIRSLNAGRNATDGEAGGNVFAPRDPALEAGADSEWKYVPEHVKKAMGKPVSRQIRMLTPLKGSGIAIKEGSRLRYMHTNSPPPSPPRLRDVSLPEREAEAETIVVQSPVLETPVVETPTPATPMAVFETPYGDDSDDSAGDIPAAPSPSSQPPSGVSLHEHLRRTLSRDAYRALSARLLARRLRHGAVWTRSHWILLSTLLHDAESGARPPSPDPAAPPGALHALLGHEFRDDAAGTNMFVSQLHLDVAHAFKRRLYPAAQADPVPPEERVDEVGCREPFSTRYVCERIWRIREVDKMREGGRLSERKEEWVREAERRRAEWIEVEKERERRWGERVRRGMQERKRQGEREESEGKGWGGWVKGWW